MRDKFAALQKPIKAIGDSVRFTENEYRGSINGLNIFFGAILGVSLGNIEDMPLADYVTLLFITSAIVAAILMVSYSHRRTWNSVLLAGVLAFMWYLRQTGQSDLPIIGPDKLLPTLSVWAVMAIMTEFTDRIAAPDTTKAELDGPPV